MISVFYLTRAKLLSPRAHMHNIVKTCEALEGRGLKLTLLAYDKALKDLESINDFFKSHNIKKEFKIISLDSLANRFKFKGFRIFNFLEVFFGNLTLIKFLFRKRRNFGVIYYRDHLLFPAALFAKYFLGKILIFESHYILNKWHSRVLTNFAVKISDGVIAISKALTKRFKKYNKNIISVFCAAKEFSIPKIYSKKKIRKELKLPIAKIIVGYTGNMSVTGMGESYGIEEIVGSLKYLPNKFVFVGVGDKIGEAQFLVKLAKKEKLDKRVMILPWSKREIIPKYLAVFDILVIPQAGGRPGNMPTKIYEYLGTGKPIVACATEAILETMHDQENCLIIKSNSPKEWAEKINKIFNDDLLRKRLVKKAKEDSKKYTWENRGNLIFKFINSNVKE